VLCSSKEVKVFKFAPKVYKCFLHGYDSNSCAYRVFNKYSCCVEITCDTVFDETNDSQVEQYDLDVVDDEEAPYEALQRMTIGEVRSQDPSETPSPNDSTPPAKGLNQNEHEDKDEHQDQVQEESNDQGGDEDDGDKREGPPHPRLHQIV
jgi:hypothetical protein